MKTKSLSIGLCVMLLLAGCASAPSGGGILAPVPAPAAETEAVYRDFEYRWRDAAFYRDWYDATAFVLPPPLSGAAARSGVKVAPAGADAGALREVDFDGATAGAK